MLRDGVFAVVHSIFFFFFFGILSSKISFYFFYKFYLFIHLWAIDDDNLYDY